MNLTRKQNKYLEKQLKKLVKLINSGTHIVVHKCHGLFPNVQINASNLVHRVDVEDGKFWTNGTPWTFNSDVDDYSEAQVKDMMNRMFQVIKWEDVTEKYF
jgi:hypothetical protein